MSIYVGTKKRFSDKLLFIFLLLAVSFFVWGRELFVSIRVSDIFIIGALISYFLSFSYDKSLLFFLCCFLSMFLISSISYLLGSGGVDHLRLAFLYKYVLAISLPYLFLKAMRHTLYWHALLVVLYVSYIFMVLWVYFYVFSQASGLLMGVSRVSFPGASSYLVSDAHLYSSCLAIATLSYMLFMRHYLSHGLFFSTVIIIFSIGALLLTGSRNGLVSLFVGLLSYSFMWLIFSRKLNVGHFISMSFLLFFVFLACVFSIFYFEASGDVAAASMSLLDRAFNFDLAQDASSLGRVHKLNVAIQDVIHTDYFLGASPLGSSLLWYDGILSITLAHFGFLGVVFLVFTAVYIFFVGLRAGSIADQKWRVFFSLLISYIVANLVTEFVLVTRGALPSIAFICLVYSFSHQDFTSNRHE